jgi:hypothetical protein
MADKEITLKFVVPMVVAIALGLSIGAAYLTDKYNVLIDQTSANQSAGRGIAELPKPDGRLSRVHLLLSNMK